LTNFYLKINRKKKRNREDHGTMRFKGKLLKIQEAEKGLILCDLFISLGIFVILFFSFSVQHYFLGFSLLHSAFSAALIHITFLHFFFKVRCNSLYLFFYRSGFLLFSLVTLVCAIHNTSSVPTTFN